MAELQVMQLISSASLPCVVKFVCAFQSEHSLYLVQQYYAGGEFRQLLDQYAKVMMDALPTLAADLMLLGGWTADSWCPSAH